MQRGKKHHERIKKGSKKDNKNLKIHEAMTVLYMRFPVQFSQIDFSCYLVWKHPKTTNGSHVWGCCAFFSENQPNVLKFGFFCQNMMLVWLKDSNKYYGAFGKRCLKVNKLKDLFFNLVFDLFMGNLSLFFPFQKVWE